MRTTTHTGRKPGSRGFSLLEILVSLAILLAGVVTILFLFPNTLRAGSQAALRTEAALLAQMKAEEVRRDDDAYSSGTLVTAIAALTDPTAPIPFPQQPNLTYSFSGKSLLYPENSTEFPVMLWAPGVARVIVRYAPEYRQSQDVVHELRFSN
jgi:prepilin-type N-terminal cleavage/methylation domain-containing protein